MTAAPVALVSDFGLEEDVFVSAPLDLGDLFVGEAVLQGSRALRRDDLDAHRVGITRRARERRGDGAREAPAEARPARVDLFFEVEALHGRRLGPEGEPQERLRRAGPQRRAVAVRARASRSRRSSGSTGGTA